MLIVMTVEAQQFPVTPVEGIVVMIVVLVMNRELGEFLALKLSTTVGTHPRK